MSKFCGFTRVDDGDEFLVICHGGNMGNTVELSVDPNLKIMGYPSVAELKQTHEVIQETGHPDYEWMLKLKKP